MKRTLLAFGALALTAQDITVNPNRPSFANPATVTQPGVAELEFGLQRTLFRDDSRSDYQTMMLKLGLGPDFELRFGWNGLQRTVDSEGTSAQGPTDPSFGFTWRLVRQEAFGADLAVSFAHKLPRASVLKGMGSGVADDTLILLASKDFGSLHADFNVLETWVGQPGGRRLRQPAAALAFGHPLAGRWSLGAELYGIAGGEAGPTIVATLWNLAYQVSPRLVLDAGFDRGLSHEAPRWNLFVGFTWGLGRFKRATAH